jgi:hypothetical protein
MSRAPLRRPPNIEDRANIERENEGSVDGAVLSDIERKAGGETRLR